MRKAIFLDRDGVINEDSSYVGKKEQFIFINKVFEALKKIQKHYLIIIVTNQSGIGRGYYTYEDYIKVTNYMLEEFSKQGIKIEKVYYCPHVPDDNCKCRKPNPFFLLQAQKEYGINLSTSWVIGDKLLDIEMGKEAGCKTLLIDSPYVSHLNILKCKNLYEAVEVILRQ